MAFVLNPRYSCHGDVRKLQRNRSSLMLNSLYFQNRDMSLKIEVL